MLVTLWKATTATHDIDIMWYKEEDVNKYFNNYFDISHKVFLHHPRITQIDAKGICTPRSSIYVLWKTSPKYFIF